MATRISLGAQHALLVLLLQIGLGFAFDSLPPGTKTQAAGACLTTLLVLASGFVLGARERSRARGNASSAMAPRGATPWASVLVAALFLAGAGALGTFLGALGPVLPPGTLQVGGIARAVFAVDASFLGPLLLFALGAALGVNAAGQTLGASLLGFLLLAALTLLGAQGARFLAFDAVAIAAIAIGASLLAALVTGLVVSWTLGRLAFVELVSVALLGGYAIFLVAAFAPSAWLLATNLPEEQIFLALAFGPTVLYAALLTAGGSVGFLLHGGGRFDPQFGFEVGVARRYLAAPSPGWFVGVVSVISVLGVCLGVMALIVVLSVMSGFEEDLKRKILGAHAHMVVGKHGDDFTEYAEIEARVREVEGVQSAAAFVLGDGMISTDSGLSGALIKGIDPTSRQATRELRANTESGDVEYLIRPDLIPGVRPRLLLPSPSSTISAGGAPAPPRELLAPAIRSPTPEEGRALPGIIIGRELSRTLRAYPGDTVKVVSPFSDEIGPLGPSPRLRRFRVAGVFYSGMYEYDAKFAYIDIKRAQGFFGMRRRATGVEVKVEDIDQTARIADEVGRRIGGAPYTIRDWREMNKELFSALLLEKIAMFVALTMIVMVASFLIVATLVMIVLQRGKEIAILKSIGASDATIMKIFMIQGLIVGAGGALLGVVAGVLVCLFLETFGVGLDENIFYIERLPVSMDWTEIGIIALAAAVISYLATIYPAMTAAQLRPVEGLRDD